MTKTSLLVTVVLPLSLCVNAENLSIGSIVSEGDLRIDNHPAKVSGTLFDGSVVETGHGEQSSASVRLTGGTTLTLYGDSRGALHRDHFVLLSGQAQVTPSAAFRTEAGGLVITSTGAGSRGIVSVGPDGALNLLVKTGTFRVVKDGGEFLTQIGPGKPASFSHLDHGGWWMGGYSGSGFDRDRDHHHCYVDDDNDRDCEQHHHHHPSK